MPLYTGTMLTEPKRGCAFFRGYALSQITIYTLKSLYKRTALKISYIKLYINLISVFYVKTCIAKRKSICYYDGVVGKENFYEHNHTRLPP